MSDNLDIRARLSADDKMSPTIQKLLSQLDRLQAKLGRGFGKDSIGAKILSDDDLKRLNLWDKRFDGFTKTHLDWARRVRDANGLTAASWGNITNKINDQVKAYDKANKAQKEGIRKEIERLYKRAQALKSIANQDVRDRGDMESRAQENIAQIQTVAHRNEQRRQQQHHSQLLSARRQFFAGMSKLAQQASSVGRTAGLTGLAAVGATAALGRASIRSGVEVDRAETFARMNMDQSKLNGRTMRNDWALPTGIKMGIDPAALFQQGVEAAKAGVPEAMSEAAAELSTMTAKRFGIDPTEMMTAIGRSVAQEIGSGRMKGDDISGLRRKFNIASSLAAETATDPAETLSFLRSGLGAGASVGMSDVGSLAFGNASILAGGQARQSARYLSHLGITLSDLEMRRKQIQSKGGTRSPEDRLFMQVPNLLGYGSLANIRKSLKDDPDEGFSKLIKSFGNIKDLEKRNQALHAFFGDEFGPIIRNMIDAPGMLDDSLRIARKAAAEASGKDGIARAWDEYQKGTEFMLDRIGAVWKVFKAEIGDTLKPYINQLSQWAEDQYKAIGTSGLKARLKAVIDGLLKGFTGKDGATLRDLLDKAFGKPGDMNGGQVDSFFKFAFGFADGLRSVAKAVGDTFKTIAGAFGTNTDDPEAMGRFAAKLVGLVVALNLLSPVIGVITTLAVGIGVLTSALKIAEGLGFFKLLSKIPGVSLGKQALTTGAKVATGAAAPWLPFLLMGDGRGDNSPGDMKALNDELKALQEKRKAKASGEKSSSGEGGGLFHPSRYIGDSIQKLDGNIQRAAFLTYGDRAFNGGGFGGGGIQTAFSGGGGGGLPSIMRSTPGAALPSFGVGPSGSIIRRGNGTGSGSQGFGSIPSGGPADMSTGQGLAGSEFLKARRTKFDQEIQNDPNLRLHLAAMQMTEGASRGGTIESLMNRTDMQGSSLRKTLGYSADGKINPRSFYGPIRRGELGPAIEKLRRNPKLFNYYDGLTDRALAGSHVIGGYTDQGLPTDPNGSKRTGIPGLHLRDPRTGKQDGNEFTDWAGAGRQKAINFRHFLENGINGDVSKVPSPADAVKNVPPASTPMSGGGDGGGSRGPVAIHINGGQHDPEALATLVQRRVDESMNWRAHDSESEYT
jgi:hypothetical protein